MISARLIMLAGGLQRLAKFPASTVQLLGAEKAMFRAKKENQRKPKHGAIFMHPLIHGAPYWRRGKVARMMAGKASIAARVDYNHGENIGEALRSEMERKALDIAKRYPEAPKRERPQTERPHEKGRERPRADRQPRRHSY
jgi:nucleolar protein 56